MTKDEVFAEIRKRDANLAVVSFSGGNDEGGADSITLYMRTVTDKQTSSIEVGTVEPDSDDFAVALEQPVRDKYGSFAGDFDVSGDLKWDATARTCVMTGEESQWESFEPEQY